MRKMLARALSFSALAAFGFAGAGHAQAAGEQDGIETIVVTVQKREQQLQDVPINVTAFSGGALERIGITKLDELSLYVPGLEIQEQSPNNPGFVIRGITSDDGAGFQEQRVAVFQDGVPISRARGAYVGLFDIERVEAVKGPQATLFGRGALVGALSIIRNKPNFDRFSANLEASGGELESQRFTGAVNVPLVEGQGGMRLAALYADREGSVANTLGGTLSGNGVEAYRLSFAAEPTERLRFDLAFDYQTDDWEGTAFKSGTYAALGGNTSPFTPASLNRSSPLIEGGKPLGIERELWSWTLNTRWNATEALTLSTVASTREFDSLEVFDPDGFSLPALLVAEQATGEQTYFEARANYDAGGLFSGFVGVSSFNEVASQRVPLAFNIAALQLIAQRQLLPFRNNLGALPAPFAGAIAATPAMLNEFANVGKTQSIDVFADGTLRLIDGRLELIAGVRQSQDEKTSTILGRVAPGSVALFAFNTPPSQGPRGRSEEFDGTTWRFVSRFAFSDAFNVYASYARGRRPDVIAGAQSAGNQGSFSLVPAEEVDNYEVGAKGVLFDGRLSFDASAFMMEYSNFQATRFNAQGQIEVFNAGAAEAPGFEGQLSIRPVDWFNLGANYAYNGFEFTTGARRGNQGRLSPRHSSALFAEFNWPLGETARAYLRPSYTWQSKVFFDDDNDRPELQCRPQAALGLMAAGQTRSAACAALSPTLPANVANFDDVAQDEFQDAYGLFNLRLGVEGIADRFAVGLFANNVLDEEYVVDAGNTGDSFGGATYIRGAPRIVGVELKAAF